MSIGAIDFDGCTPDEREQLLDALHARQAALHVEQLRAIRAADEAGDWQVDGMHSMADWLAYRYRMSHSTARATVAAARALETLPKTMAVYETGRISFDQLTAALSFAKPEDDAHLAVLLPELGAVSTSAMAKQRRRVAARERDEADRRTCFRFRDDSSGLGRRVSGFFGHEDAALIEASLARRAEAMGPDAETGTWAPNEERLARALRDQCEEDLSEHNRAVGGDAHVVVVHVPEATVRGDDGAGSATIGGGPIHHDTLRRILCDTKIEFSIDEPDGRTVGIGRAGRTLPRWLRRRVLGRDHGCCRWPGCCRPARHVHHLRHWTRDGGPTNSSNLVGLCWHHHHLLHEGGWEATGNADAEVTFVSPLRRQLRSRAGPVAA
jgi:hypothetical protein